MICAKAANMDLVVLVKTCSREGWYVRPNQRDTNMNPASQYFLCLPQHTEACLQWLNDWQAKGEDPNNTRSFDDYAAHIEAIKWSCLAWYMREDRNYDYLTSEWQLIDFEVEV